METVSLFELPHSQVRALLASGAPVYLAVDPVEYHGPHLSLHNDGLISMGIARDVHALLTEDSGQPFLVASRIDAGVEPVPGPGTRATPYPVVVDLVTRACDALADLGATRVVLMTFHGAPLHSIALHAGVRRLALRGVRALAPLNLLMRELLNVDPSAFGDAFECIEDAGARALAMRDLARDFHAGFFETSIALHYVPDTVAPSYKGLPPCPEPRPHPALERFSRWAARAGRRDFSRELHVAALGLGWATLRPFPGYTGRHHLARAEAGAAFARHIARRFAGTAREVFAGAPPPQPIMRWLPALSLGGRLRGLDVPASEIARLGP
jgi:creatinine amidohydrolase